MQRKKPSVLLIDDSLETAGNTQAYIDLIRSELVLSEPAFNALHPFPGNKYLEYFGNEKPFGTIYCIPYSQGTTPIVKELHENNTIDLKQVSNEEL